MFFVSILSDTEDSVREQPACDSRYDQGIGFKAFIETYLSHEKSVLIFVCFCIRMFITEYLKTVFI